MEQKHESLEQLKLLYLFTFILTAILIVPTHLFPQPYFMPFRFPHYLQMMEPFWGISWPMSFKIYHYGIYFLIITGCLNFLGIISYSKFRKTAIFSSFVGILFFSLMALFFFFVFLQVNFSTAVIYGLYSVILLITDWLTFKALTKEQKEASRG